MEDIGAEVSLKIRSAIKAKLVELGAYVDDELPDYIMVMVANKRSKVQMDNDLKLFLGTNTHNFTCWLHTVLQKLQEVTIANNLNKQNVQPVTPDKSLNKSKPIKINSPPDDDDHKRKHKKKQRKSSDGTSKRRSTDSKKMEKMSEVKLAESAVEISDSNRPILIKDNDATKVNQRLDSKSKDASKTSSQIKSTPKKYLTESLLSLESEIEAKQKLVTDSESRNLSVDAQLPAATKVLPVVGSRITKSDEACIESPRMVDTTSKVLYSSVKESTPIVTRKPVMMQSDDEDFEDIINIKDTETMDFLDAEFPEDVPKVTRTIVLTSEADSSLSKPSMSVKVRGDADMEVDDLEEQRAKLLRDLKQLEKPPRSSRPTIEKYSVTKLMAPKTSTSVLNRLGSVIDPEPRLRLIDPDDFNIAGPPNEVELPKPRFADRSGEKTSSVSESRRTISVVKKDSSEARNGSAAEIKSGREEVARRNVMDRLGKRTSPQKDNERGDDSKSRNVFSALNDRKTPKETEAKRNVMDRLGKRPSSSSVNDREKKHADEPDSSRSKLNDRLGPKRRSSSKDRVTSKGKDARQQERDTFKSRLMDRLGKNDRKSSREEISDRTREFTRTREPERLKMSDRLGKKVTSGSTSPVERDSVKRAKRVISIKDALAGELQHSSAKRSSTDLEEKEKEELPRKRLLLSRVVAVPREEEEAVDTSVASVIRVQPRPKVPAAMQANKNLLLKAMAEAQKSVAAAPGRQEFKPEPDLKEGLFTRKYRDVPPEKINITLANVKPEEPEEAKLTRLTRTVPNVNQRTKPDSTQQKPEGKQGESPSSDVGNEAAATVKEDDEDEVLEEIYEEDELSAIASNRSVVGSTIANVSPVNDYGDDDEYAVAKDEVHYSAEEEPELQQNYNAGRNRERGNTQFVVTLDGLDPATMFNSRKRNVEHQQLGQERPASPLPVPEHERIHNWLLTLERAKEDKEHKERNASPVAYKKARLASTADAPVTVNPAKQKSSERCKFWPACRLGEMCEFVHPSIPCKSFPGCKFGDMCMYVHPKCKYDTACTRRDCPYSHPGTGPTIAPLPLSRPRTSHTQTTCKFFPKCSNVNCPFIHPKACRFGRACTKSECTFYHEELPSTEKLKWVKTN